MLSENTRWVGAATVLARVGLGTAFLSAVADRLGLWGPAGTNHVFWGNFHNFTEYLRSLAPYLPAALVDPTAWGVTVVEVVLGVALLSGVGVRWAAIASAATLIVFGASMF